MTGKSAFYALAVAVLMGTMAVAALADDQRMDSYGPADSSVSSQPEQGVEQPDAGEIREPMETGAVPGSAGGFVRTQMLLRARSRRWRSEGSCSAPASIGP